MSAFHGQNEEFYSRVADKLSNTGNLARTAEWVKNNTFLKGKKWSFKDHEYQIGIAGETAQKMTVMKCSQIGMSELQVRITLAILAIKQGWTGIYILPNSKFAQKFAKGRIDPIIEGSPRLTELVVPAANNSEMKRFGHSTLYIGGASTETQAISIPADFLIKDEFDFCDMSVLNVYASRLRHAYKGGMERTFSTPTIPGYGVSLEHATSSRARYFVKCRLCGHWSAPVFTTDIIIPGFDREFKYFDKSTLDDPKVKVNQAYIPCPHCKKSLEQSFGDPENREWVHEFPTLEHKGFSIKPFDVIAYNPTTDILKQAKKYETAQYWNYALGEAYLTKDTQVDNDTVKNNTVEEEQMRGSGYYLGVDVGKTLYVTVGKRIGGRLRVVRFIRVEHTEGNLLAELKDIFLEYGAYRMVIDAGPDHTIVQEMQAMFGDAVTACVYLEDAPKVLTHFVVPEDDAEGRVFAYRTKHFDILVRDINQGRITFPMCQEIDLVKKHLVGMKRVEQMDKNGDKVFRWVKTDPDHYLHSLGYMKLANDIDGAPDASEAEISHLPKLVSGVHVNEIATVKSEVANALRALGFGTYS